MQGPVLINLGLNQRSHRVLPDKAVRKAYIKLLAINCKCYI